MIYENNLSKKKLNISYMKNKEKITIQNNKEKKAFWLSFLEVTKNITKGKKWRHHFLTWLKIKIKRGLWFFDTLPYYQRQTIGWACLVLGLVFFYIPFINWIIFLLVAAKCLGWELSKKILNRFLSHWDKEHNCSIKIENNLLAYWTIENVVKIQSSKLTHLLQQK